MRFLKSIVINLYFIIVAHCIFDTWYNSKLENVEKNRNCNISLNNIYIIHYLLRRLKVGSGQPNFVSTPLHVVSSFVALIMDKDILLNYL